MSISSLSVVVPVFNSANCLELLVVSIDKELSRLRVPAEVIFVDDGSKDASLIVLNRFQKEYGNRVKVLSLPENQGQNAATLFGIQNAKYEYIATMDDDLSHPPELISMLVDKMSPNSDGILYVYDSRWRFSNIAKSFVGSLVGVSSAGSRSSFRLFPKNLLRGSCDGDLIDVSLTMTQLPVQLIRARFSSSKIASRYNVLSKIQYFRKLLGQSLVAKANKS